MNSTLAAPLSFREAALVWAKIGCLSFGGPAGQIALMHRVLVDERRWLDEREYLAALNFCMLLPGPEAMQLAAYAGWKLYGWRGALAAGTLFVIPGALVVFVLAWCYALYGRLPAVEAVFFGIKAAVVAIVVEALVRVAKRALRDSLEWWLAAVAFLALYFLAAPFPLVIVAAGLIGFWFGSKHSPTGEAAGSIASAQSRRARGARPAEWRKTLWTVALWLCIWLLPVALLAVSFGTDHVFSRVAFFFSKLAVVTFGGAYAVLSYLAQQSVESYGWLTAGEMIDGLGLAETTPGPLILVTEFVGFIAGYRRAGGVTGGAWAAVITLWVTFVPCFLWILAGAPYIERLRDNPRLSGALSAITAAVVGVILNLTLWFGLHVMFGSVERAHFGWFQPWLPRFATLDAAALALSIIAAIALLRFHIGLVRTLAVCATLGAAYRLL